MGLIGGAAVCPAASRGRVHDRFNWAPSTHVKRGIIMVPLRGMAAAGGSGRCEYLPFYSRWAEMFSDVDFPTASGAPEAPTVAWFSKLGECFSEGNSWRQ